MILLLVSFVAGILTILAPCVLPLLPVIVGGSVGGGKSLRRAITVTASLAVSVIVFTLLIKAGTLLIGVSADFWKGLSGGIIIIFGLISIFPSLWEKLPFLSKMSIGSNKVLASGYRKQNIWGDVIVGASLGPVFSSCSPTYFLVIAAILPGNFTLGIVYITAYSIGLSLALLLVAFVGQKILSATGVAADPRGKFKKVLGVIFVIVGIAIITGADKTLQIKIFDAGFFDVTKIEQKLLEFVPFDESQETQVENKKVIPQAQPTDLNPDKDQPSAEMETRTIESKTVAPAEEPLPVAAIKDVVTNQRLPSEVFASKDSLYARSPEITNPSGFVNTADKSITLKEFVGKKVVLVSFWTYSCINCQRTLPYLNTWYEKYKDQGLEIVSIHTPEFAYEKLQKNVEDEVFNTYSIQYPVVLDNDYSTWKAFGNRYWPRKYLIDVDGYIVYDHIGEGAYDETEKKIQEALKERAERLEL
jgi:cytochrome c biogenesis protein CcdA/thiol-disulfide isomerase/thioredoxin